MKKVVLLFLIIVFSILLFVKYSNRELIIIVPNLEVNSEYKLDKIEVCYGNKYKCDIVNAKILKIDSIDNSVIGKQKVSFTVEYKGNIQKIEKEIEIIDDIKPIITLEEVNIENVCDSFVNEKNYTAIDNYDGDITDKVKVIRDGNTVIYKVSDSSGNEIIQTRNVNFNDNISPTLKVNSYDTDYVKLGSIYKEPMYSAIDNCDGDITDKVIKEGNVDTSKVGEYNISYKIIDSSNNISTVNRKVIVSDFKSNTNSNKIIYLTYDDGPCVYTNQILDVLKKYNVKATFFVTGQFGYFDMIKREYEEGHTIGLHTYSHDFRIYKSSESYFEDLNKIEDVVYKKIGIKPKLIRFPGGTSNTVSRNYKKNIMTELSREVIEKGYNYVDWSIDSGDSKSRSASSYEIYKNVINSLSVNRVNIVLMHDIKKQNIESTELIIKYALANGWTFLPISENTPLVKARVNN